MNPTLLMQRLVGSMGVEVTFGDAVLLRMLDNFTPVSALEGALEAALAEMAEKINATMQALGAPLEEALRRLGEAIGSYGVTLS